MNRHVAIGLFLNLLLLLAAGCGSATTRALAPGEPADPALAARVLRSTVVIRITAPYLNENGERQYLVENGQEVPLNAISSALGTIVSAGEGTFIVTTDHFDQLAAPSAEVTFTDFSGNQIMLSLPAFRSLIRYQDNDIIILSAPPGLPEGAEPGDGDQSLPGNQVHVVHRQPATGELSVITAVIEHWIDYRGVPSFQLRNIDGELIEPGNSGGGVWLHGRLVGSIHRTILLDETGATDRSGSGTGFPSHLSYATRLSPARMPLLNQGQPIAALTE